MAGENVVRILVTADDQASAGFDETKAGAEDMAGSVEASLEEYQAALAKATEAREDFAAAQADQSEASARVTELQQDETASTEELAAAQDQLTAASLRSADARKALADSEAEVATMTQAASDEQVASGVKSDESAGMFAGAGSKMKMAALGVAVGLGLAVKGAADFQQQTVRLVTSAGESAKNLGMVQRGILALSSSTNTSTSQLASGMYMVESAGFHGAAGLTVLKAAAQGAQAEGADLADVANAVTSGLNAYGMKASDATKFTNEMVTAVGQGKMTMEALSSSLSAVLPIAASAHISFAQVGGAIATMTGMGMSARQSTQDLAATIRGLLHPSGVASQEMRAMGVNALQVSQNLGKQGLTGTMQELSDAVLKNTQGGTVLLGYMHSMTPAAQGLARQILSGSISTMQLRQAVYNLNPEQAKLISLFDTAATSATGLKQTYAGAMSAMMGGATGLNTSLMLTGTHAKTFADNVKAIGGAAQGAGSNVKGWAHIQGEANFQLGSAVKAIEAMGDSLGLALLPSVTAVLKPITSFFELIAKNKAAAIAFAAVLGTLLAGALGAKLASALSDAKAGLSTLFDVIGNAPSAISSMASGFASAASSVASFTVQTVKQLGEAMVATGAWIAEHAVAAASFIAENVAMAASATAAFIAENAATLGIVAGIALLVAGIVYLATHWRQVWDLIKHIFDDAVSFIKAHLSILAEVIGTILLGPLGFLVAYIATHWNTVKRLTEDLWHDVAGFFTSMWHDVTNIVSGLWHDVVSFFESLVDDLVSLAETLWHNEVSNWERVYHDTLTWVERLFHDVVSWFEQLPGRIMAGIAALPGMLLHAGEHAIDSLIDGLSSGIGKIGSVMGGIASKIAGFIGLSPAREGPLSGSGAMYFRGLHIPQDVAAGIYAGLPGVATAAHRLAGTVALGGGAGGATGGGGGLALDVRFSGTDSQIIKALWPHLKLEVRSLGGGGPFSAQKALGSTWPAGA